MGGQLHHPLRHNLLLHLHLQWNKVNLRNIPVIQTTYPLAATTIHVIATFLGTQSSHIMLLLLHSQSKTGEHTWAGQVSHHNHCKVTLKIY